MKKEIKIPGFLSGEIQLIKYKDTFSDLHGKLHQDVDYIFIECHGMDIVCVNNIGKHGNRGKKKVKK